MEYDATSDNAAEPDGGSEPRIWNTVQGRVALLLTLAILPLGLIAVLQTQRAVSVASDAYRSALAAQTADVARPERRAIQAALEIAGTLAVAVKSTGFEGEACEELMTGVAGSRPEFRFVGVSNSEGVTRCNNLGREIEFANTLEGENLIDNPRRDIAFNPNGRATGAPVVVVNEPVYGDNSEFLGYVALSFSARPLESLREAADLDDRVRLVTFDISGHVLTADVPRDDLPDILPANQSLEQIARRGTRVFSAISGSGETLDYAVVPIIEGEAYALGTWSPDVPLASMSPLSATTLLFPILMWLVTLGVAIWALHRQVVQPIRKLRMRMRSFEDGRSIFRGNSMQSAPSELREIGAAFEEFADKIVRDEAELEDKVHERDILLREVHHRVKNNLQLMSSIINMQIRQTEAPAAEEALRSVQSRLTSLAKFHQDLYQSTTLSKLRADTLIHDLAQQVFSIGKTDETPIDLRLDLDEVVLSPDQASALAMLTTEALTNALKYTSADPGTEPHVRLALKWDDMAQDRLRLEVENSVAANANDNPAGLGSRLILAFGSQLEAQVRQERQETNYLLTVTFIRQPLKSGDEGTLMPPIR